MQYQMHSRRFISAVFLLLTAFLYPVFADAGSHTSEDIKQQTPSIQQAMQENRLLSRMYPLLFRDETEPVPHWDLDLEEWRGRKIGRVEIVMLDVFSSPQTSSKVVSQTVALGNFLHPKTRKNSLQNLLFFAEGDTLEPELIISNLHYLYASELFSEIQIVVDEIENDELEITVILREKFFLQVSGKYISRDKYNIRITDRNFLGTGYLLRNSWYVDPQNQGSIGWESSLKNPNLFGTFVQSEFGWADLPGYQSFDIEVQRPFLYPLFRYSGGADFLRSSVSPPRDSLAVKKHEAGLWLARNYELFDYPRYAYSALSVEQSWYQKRPYSSSPQAMPWQESTFFLAALGLTQSSFRYLPRISSFLDNDYLPAGYLIELYGGYEFGEFKDRAFAGLHTSWSAFPDEDQYLYLSSALETYLSNTTAEQAVFAIEPMYISHTKNVGSILGRSFIRARYIHGYRRLDTETVKLSSDPLYRGRKDLQGTSLFFVSLEEDLSFPISIFGFQLAAFGFVDLAIADDSRNQADGRQNIISEGLGVRLRNPSLVWDFIELFVSMTHSSSSANSFGIELNLKRAFSLQDFQGRRPRSYRFD